MEAIEIYARPYITNLMLGRRQLLEPVHQYALAAFLSLVAIRIDISNRTAQAIPKEDHQHLIENREPGSTWKIWIMRYTEGAGDDYSYAHSPMAMRQFHKSQIPRLTRAEIAARPEDSNTQVTTICVGRLCAHIFSSTDFDEFTGYDGIDLTQLWPITGLAIDTGPLPSIDRLGSVWLHETISRSHNPPRVT